MQVDEARLPSFLVIGAEKSGTTWLYRQLHAHPDVFVPETKELHFFNARTSNLEERKVYENQGLGWYADFFRHVAGETAVGEVTPMYLCDDVALERIRRDLPEVRAVCLLRNPVDRAYAHYWMARAKGHVTVPFDVVAAERDTRFIERGNYGGQVERAADLLGRDRVLVLFYEEVFEDPAAALATVADHLGVDPGGFDEERMQSRENAASGYRSPGLLRGTNRLATAMRKRKSTSRVMDVLKSSGAVGRFKRLNAVPTEYPPLAEDTRAELVAYYEDDVGRLEAAVGRPVPWTPTG